MDMAADGNDSAEGHGSGPVRVTGVSANGTASRSDRRSPTRSPHHRAHQRKGALLPCSGRALPRQTGPGDDASPVNLAGHSTRLPKVLHGREDGEQRMDDLLDTLKQCVDRLVRYRSLGRRVGEQNTKAGLIEPVIAALGWDVLDRPDDQLRSSRGCRMGCADQRGGMARVQRSCSGSGRAQTLPHRADR